MKAWLESFGFLYEIKFVINDNVDPRQHIQYKTRFLYASFSYESVYVNKVNEVKMLALYLTMLI